MTDIVILSDSNESVLSIESNNEPMTVKDRNKKKSSLDDSDSSEFEFPEVQFYHVIDEDNVVESENTDSRNYSSIFNTSPSSCQSNDKHTVNSKTLKQHHKQPLHNVTNSPNSANDSEEENTNVERQKKNKTLGKKNKDQLIEERLKRQKQLMRQKVQKAITAKKSKNIKPGECMKFMEVVLDKGIENFACITDIVNTLIDANLQYSIKTEFISNSITWNRCIENNYVNESNEICTITNVEKVTQILIIWNWDEAVTKVADGSFCRSVSSIRSSISEYKIILVIFGIDDYFAHRKEKKTSGKNGTKNKMQKTHAKNNLEFKKFPEISRRELETCLNEVQITTGCNSRLINNSQNLALMIYQCTKAIAEIPYKLEKNKNLTNKFDWYVMGDNRNTVKVDKDGNGLKRLWQQQLCQFNLSSLEIAEAICSVYPSPADLIEAYMNCTDNEGMNLLKDIPIRRAAGPLTAIRKVGPELSKKIYLMFTSKNGENLLS